jgi:hypothetical protein
VGMTASLTSVLRCWRAGVVLVAVACLAPGRASAGCGDYVTIIDASGNPAHNVAADDHGTPPPCQGPNCSGSPVREAPPLAPAAPAGGQPQELTPHPGPAGGPDAGPAATLGRDSTSPRPIRRPSPVFHPPRAG